MTTPLGSPAWVRTAGITDYGGATDKADFLGIGVVSPATDVEAAALMRLSDHMASLARVAPFAVLKITCNDSTPAAPTVQYCNMMTGVSLVSYEGDSAPSGYPPLARVSDGVFTITFATSYTDEYGVSGSFYIRCMDACANSSANINAVAKPNVIGGVVATVKLFTADTGAAVPDETCTLSVW